MLPHDVATQTDANTGILHELARSAGTAARGTVHDPYHPLSVEFRGLLLETARIHLVRAGII
jgi:hypothetical protein